ncbi:BatA domain-containing protein [Planctomicrobium piriforme]|uniref:N-terminal double-transmembrane domain-containing protein n=1 Tax=Planctomicrobium piriforme TaxID=1576369 RepID=A0A1I3R7L4_9PLAN|nr:BatA domain-containing protein [Planctomicrobium piriforme]SFJ41411.1 N-terminal double-transmembrane domain-containing protein [Planctomicrobium piriforme]
MNFLQPVMLFALPLIALPIIIHLVNQRRFRTIRWSAMMFLLAANRMSRGYARLRQWIILAARTLAIAGLLFAVSRPLTSGWLSLAAGGRPDTTYILVDRSPSMLQQGRSGGVSKLVAACRRLAESLRLIGSQHWLLIDSAGTEPVELESPELLTKSLQVSGISSTSDLPNMLQQVLEDIRKNRPGRSEVWICSDVRQADWDAESGRWQALRDQFFQLPQPVRFHLLAYADAAPTNRSVRVTGVRRIETTAGAELLVSLCVRQQSPAESPVIIPVQLEIDGARSEIPVELTGSEVEIKDHAVPLDHHQLKGWGQVSIPADANAADNQFFFVYDRPVPRKTLVVSEDRDAAQDLELASSILPDEELAGAVEWLAPDQLKSAEWESVCLVLWQAPLPEEEDAKALQEFLDRGGVTIFFPPAAPTNAEFAGLSWGEWIELQDHAAVSTWVDDQDLLANTRSGSSLPVGQLGITRYCTVRGDQTPLATLTDGSPLLARALTDKRNVYFMTTTSSAGDSTLATEGVVLYVMVQRALSAGAATLGAVRQYFAGHFSPEQMAQWQRLAGATDALTVNFAFQAGVYSQADQLIAINRSDIEDQPTVVPDTRVASLFEGLEFDRVDDSAEAGSPLLSEIWRVFLACMMFALIVESCLCVPRVIARSAPDEQLRQSLAAMRGASA